MKYRLLAQKGEHWEVWTNWYDARLDPSKRIPCYSPPVPELERARVLLPNELWEKGPAAVNAEIKRLIEEHECSKAPDRPEPLPGAQFIITPEEQLDVIPQPPAEEEAQDPRLQKQFARLKQRATRLLENIKPIENQYPELASIIRDYNDELSPASLADVDIDALWMVGAGILAQAEAFRKTPEGVLTPPLEQEVAGLLFEVAALHGAFILGFAAGRELADRQLQLTAGPNYRKHLAEAVRQFIEALEKLDEETKTPRAQDRFRETLDLLALKVDAEYDRILRATVPVAYNILGVVGEFLLAAYESKGLDRLISLGGMGLLGGLLTLFQQQFGPIAAIAQITPEMRAYIRHLFECYGWPWPDDDDDPQE